MGSFHHRKKGKLTPNAEAREAGEGGQRSIESLGKEKEERSRQDDRCHLVKKSHMVTEDSSAQDLGTCNYLCLLPPLNSKFHEFWLPGLFLAPPQKAINIYSLNRQMSL